MAKEIIVTEAIALKWEGVVNTSKLPALNEDQSMVMTQLLENTTQELGIDITEESTSLTDGSIPDTPADGTGLNPLLIGVLRRAMPTLMGNHWLGVHALSGPNGVIIASHVRKITVPNDGTAKTSEEVWKDARPDVNHSGDGAGNGMSSETGETLGTEAATDGTAGGKVYQTNPWQEMAFDLTTLNVGVKTRALKSYLTNEVIDDMQKLYGINAVTKLQGILRGQLTAEIDYELFNWVQTQAKVGAQTGTAVAGTYNFATDPNGRWENEDYRSFVNFMDREANIVGKETRFGRANVIITSPNMANALENVAKFEADATIPSSLQTGNWVGMSFMGTFMNKYRVFTDPYASSDFMTLIFKGSTPEEAGGYYCPYVPFRFYEAKGEEDFNPRIGIKTRYGLIHNPYASGNPGENPYFRTFNITNL
ncbi:MAG: hypothetical protein QM489_01045 [Candidatus Izemoplasma sp.]